MDGMGLECEAGIAHPDLAVNETPINGKLHIHVQTLWTRKNFMLCLLLEQMSFILGKHWFHIVDAQIGSHYEHHYTKVFVLTSYPFNRI